MIGGSYQGGRVLDSSPNVMDRRVPIQRLELLLVIARTIIRNPCRSDRELMEPEHVQHARLCDCRPEQLRTLINHCADQQSAIRPSLNSQFLWRRIPILDQIL